MLYALLEFCEACYSCQAFNEKHWSSVSLCLHAASLCSTSLAHVILRMVIREVTGGLPQKLGHPVIQGATPRPHLRVTDTRSMCVFPGWVGLGEARPPAANTAIVSVARTNSGQPPLRMNTRSPSSSLTDICWSIPKGKTSSSSTKQRFWWMYIVSGPAQAGAAASELPFS